MNDKKVRNDIKRTIANISVCPHCNHLAKELTELLKSLKPKIDEEKLHSAIMGSYCGQKGDEKIIAWDNRVFDTRLLAKKMEEWIK